jgi:signal peptidase I
VTSRGAGSTHRPGAQRLRRVLSPLPWYASAIYLATTIALAVWAYLPMVFSWQAMVVMTGSMEPRIQPGDVIVVQPAAPATLKVGEVIVVRDPSRPGHLLSHRVVGVRPDGAVITRGDANGHDDPAVLPEDIVGIGRLRIPMVGRPERWFLTRQWPPLIGWAVITIAALWIANPRPPRRPPRPSRPQPPREPPARQRRRILRWAPTIATGVSVVVSQALGANALWSSQAVNPAVQFRAGTWSTICRPADNGDNNQGADNENEGNRATTTTTRPVRCRPPAVQVPSTTAPA